MEAASRTQPLRRRRTQQERRTAPRAALLDATIDCLVEEGYAGTTTARVVERAGLSRGAQVHHFPTKAQLVVEAVRHLADRRAAELAAQAQTLPPRAPRRMEAVLDLLWRDHSGPLFAASVEMFVAARTDPVVRAALVDLEREVTATVFSALTDVFGDLAAEPAFRELVETAMAAMRGLALLPFDRDSGELEQRWGSVRRRLLEMYAQVA